MTEFDLIPLVLHSMIVSYFEYHPYHECMPYDVMSQPVHLISCKELD